MVPRCSTTSRAVYSRVIPAKRGLSNQPCVSRTSRSNGLSSASWRVIIPTMTRLLSLFAPQPTAGPPSPPHSEVEVFGDPGAVSLECLQVPGDALPRPPEVVVVQIEVEQVDVPG